MKEKKKQVDGDVKDVKGWIGGDAGEEVDCKPSMEENSGKLLKEIGFDFVTWVTMLHRTMQSG